MPLGSSSDAPVIRPGPSALRMRLTRGTLSRRPKPFRLASCKAIVLPHEPGMRTNALQRKAFRLVEQSRLTAQIAPDHGGNASMRPPSTALAAALGSAL